MNTRLWGDTETPPSNSKKGLLGEMNGLFFGGLEKIWAVVGYQKQVLNEIPQSKTAIVDMTWF
jgi:hypothetical protein